MKKLGFLLLLFVMVVPTIISAQDTGLATDAQPRFATVTLGGDSWLDPFIISVSASTNDDTVDASTLDASCAGFISGEPSVVVNWTPSDAVPEMRVFFLSTFDPVLVVVKPDGSYACNDDFSPLVSNPLVGIPDPAQGEYRIYVGTSRQSAPFAPGFLVMTAGPATPDSFDISRLVPRLLLRQQLQRLPLSVLLLRDAPAVTGATADLSGGFEPVTSEVTGGGSLPAFNIELGNPTCTGFISALPNYAFNYAGDPETARLFFEGDADSSIMVISQDGRVYCHDDVSNDNLNPSVDVPLTPGRYVVYIGSNNPTSNVSGSLTITGDVSAEPSALAPEATETP